MVSKKCDQCWTVKRCRAYPNAHPQETGRLISTPAGRIPRPSGQGGATCS